MREAIQMFVMEEFYFSGVDIKINTQYDPLYLKNYVMSFQVKRY